MDMECFKEIKFKYRVRSANNLSKIKIKTVVIFLTMFSNGWYLGFFILNLEFYELSYMNINSIFKIKNLTSLKNSMSIKIIIMLSTVILQSLLYQIVWNFTLNLIFFYFFFIFRLYKHLSLLFSYWSISLIACISIGGCSLHLDPSFTDTLLKQTFIFTGNFLVSWPKHINKTSWVPSLM